MDFASGPGQGFLTLQGCTCRPWPPVSSQRLSLGASLAVPTAQSV